MTERSSIPHDFGSNPLLGDSPTRWSELITSIGVPALLLVIRARMSSDLLARVNEEDVLQEALLFAWRDRARCEWRGSAAFRRWLLAIIENRVRDLADAAASKKRGGGRVPVPFESRAESDVGAPLLYAGPVATTTPSRVAMDRESAATMRAALDELAPEEREVVWLRLFVELTLEETASRLDIGMSVVRRRFREGCAAYRRCLEKRLGSAGIG